MNPAMTQPEQPQIQAPEFPAGIAWLQGTPTKLADLRGRPVLIDFWDYTCADCLRTLPYVQEWHRRYKDHGLFVVGVHAPEFSFAHNADHVRRAIAEHGLEYSIVIDNDYAFLKAYANRFWPAEYLIDREGNLRYYQFGAGGYGATETAIQTLIREAFPEVLLPGLVEPVLDMDAPGAVCYRVTPELYLGYRRGRIGNPVGIVPDRPATYRDVDKHAEGYFYLEGDWQFTGESAARPVGATGESRLHVRYMAKEVNLVMHPPLAGGDARIEVLQDGAPLPAEDAGEDARVEEGRAVVTVDRPRMYRIVSNREIDTHELTLVTSDDGVALYAFSFVSCLVPGAQAEAEGEPGSP